MVSPFPAPMSTAKRWRSWILESRSRMMGSSSKLEKLRPPEPDAGRMRLSSSPKALRLFFTVPERVMGISYRFMG